MRRSPTLMPWSKRLASPKYSMESLITREKITSKFITLYGDLLGDEEHQLWGLIGGSLRPTWASLELLQLAKMKMFSLSVSKCICWPASYTMLESKRIIISNQDSRSLLGSLFANGWRELVPWMSTWNGCPVTTKDLNAPRMPTRLFLMTWCWPGWAHFDCYAIAATDHVQP